MIRLLIILVLGAIYICSPIDLIPDPAVPVGYADDLAVLVGMLLSYLYEMKNDPAANRGCGIVAATLIIGAGLAFVGLVLWLYRF